MSETHGDTFTAAEAARQLGISEAAIRKRIKAGTLQATKEGHTWRIPSEAVERSDSEPYPNRTTVPYRTAPGPSGFKWNVDALPLKLATLEGENSRLGLQIKHLQTQNERLTEELTESRRDTDEHVKRYLSEIEYLRRELTESNQRANESCKRSDTIIMKLTQQLEHANLQLEDLRFKRSWWRRMFSR